MAYEQVIEGLEVAQAAGADLSAKLFYIAKVDTDEDIVLCGDGEAPLGVIREAAVANAPVTVQVGGFAKVIAGAAFNAGVKVASDNAGKAVTATTGEYVLGIAMQGSGGDAEIVTVFLSYGGRVA